MYVLRAYLRAKEWYLKGLNIKNAKLKNNSSNKFGPGFYINEKAVPYRKIWFLVKFRSCSIIQ